MTSALYPNTYVFRAFAQGAMVPLAGGFLQFYAAGTSTPQAAYTDTTGTVPCANPLQLDANGVASFCLLSGLNYKINLTDANGVTQDGWPKDNIGTQPLTDASLVNYLAPYTGAVARTQASKNTETVSILDFGADPTGSASSQTAITAALAACSGKTLFFPAGTYKMTAAVTLPANIKLQGDGYNSTTIYQSTANSITFATNNDNEICGLKFTGTGSFSVGGRCCIECDPNNVGGVNSRVHVHDCYFDSSISTTAIGGNNHVDWIIEANVFNLGAQSEHGIYLSSAGGSGPTRVKIQKNYLNKSVSGGLGSRPIQLKGAVSCWIEDNFISGVGWDGNAIDSSVYVSSDIQIKNNRFYNLLATINSIKLSAGDNNIFISGNDINSGFHGITATGVSTLVIEGNQIKGAAFRGIEIDGTGSTRTIIQNNAVYDNASGGIRVSVAGTYTSILNNTVAGSGAFKGIEFATAATGCIIEGNSSTGYTTALDNTGGAASSNNTLAGVAYDEVGTWSSNLLYGVTVLKTVTGRYAKRGNRVRVEAYFGSMGAGGAGNVTITLPAAYPVGASAVNSMTFIPSQNVTFTSAGLAAYTYAGQTVVTVMDIKSGSYAILGGAAITGATSEVWLTHEYEVAG